MENTGHTANYAAEIIPAPYTPGQTDEETTEGRKEERAHHDNSADARNNGSNGNAAQSSGRATAQEQDAHPESTIEAEGDGGDTSDRTPKNEYL